MCPEPAHGASGAGTSNRDSCPGRIEERPRHAALAFETIAWLAGDDASLWACAYGVLDDASVGGSALVAEVVRPVLVQTRPPPGSLIASGRVVRSLL